MKPGQTGQETRFGVFVQQFAYPAYTSFPLFSLPHAKNPPQQQTGKIKGHRRNFWEGSGRGLGLVVGGWLWGAGLVDLGVLWICSVRRPLPDSEPYTTQNPQKEWCFEYFTKQCVKIQTI